MDRIIDIAIGMSDGLIVPVALTAGMYGAGMDGPSITQAGLTIVGAGSLIMGFGGYMAGRSGLEKHVVANNTGAPGGPVEAEKEATRKFLAQLDLDSDIQEKAIEDWKKEQEEWATLMETEWEHALQNKPRKKPLAYGINIGLSYLVGGLVPVLPYYLLSVPNSFYLSLTLTFLLVGLLGMQKSIAVDQPWWKESYRVVLLMVLATAGSFAVGYFIFR